MRIPTNLFCGNLLCGCLLVTAFGCKSTGYDRSPPDVQDRLLAYVPESEQTEIQRARQRRNELDEQLSAARAGLDEADSLIDLSDSDIAALRTQLGAAREQIDHQRRFGTNDEFHEAQEHRDQVEAAYRFAQSQRQYNMSLRELAQERVDLLQKRVELADARFELAKARAVSNLDRPAVEDVDVDTHRHTVQRLADEVETARIEVLAARQRVELQQKFVDQRREQVPASLVLRKIEPLDAVFEADTYENEPVQFDEHELEPWQRQDHDHEQNGNGRDGSNDGNDNGNRSSNNRERLQNPGSSNGATTGTGK